MAVAVERLAQEALALSDQERAELARKLLVSLEGPPDEGVDAAWDTEIKERVDRIREETAKGGWLKKCFGIFEHATSEASYHRGRGGT
jgi:hypothetical protein